MGYALFWKSYYLYQPPVFGFFYRQWPTYKEDRLCNYEVAQRYTHNQEKKVTVEEDFGVIKKKKL